MEDANKIATISQSRRRFESRDEKIFVSGCIGRFFRFNRQQHLWEKKFYKFVGSFETLDWTFKRFMILSLLRSFPGTVVGIYKKITFETGNQSRDK